MKKNILTIVLALLCFFSFHTANASPGPNLISNPSVEQKTGTEPTDWFRTKKGNNITVFGYKTNGFDGARSLYLNVIQYVAGESYWYFREVPVVASTTYSYSEHYKSTMATKLYAKVQTTAGTINTIFLKDVPAAANWTQVTTDFTTPPNASSVTIAHAANSLGTLQTDNFSFALKNDSGTSTSPVGTTTPPQATTTPPTASTTPPTSNPIPNPSVETVSNDPTLPLHWRKVKTGTNDATFTYLNNGHTGNKSLNVAINQYTSGLAYYQFDSAPVVGGRTYEYSFYHKSNAYSEIDIAITLTTGEVVYEYLGVSFPSTDWTRFSTRVRMPANAREVSIYNILYSQGFITSDDFSLTPVNVVPLNRPIVSITFDDFFDPFYDTVFPMFREKGYKGTVYLVSGDFNSPGAISASQLREMRDYGFEIGSHTITHPHLPFITSAQVNTELSQSKTDIATFTGVTPKNFASPYGEYNDAIKNQIRNYYRSHRSVDIGSNTKDNFDIMNIKAMPAINTTSPEAVLGWVDEAIQDKAWIVLVYHDIVNGGGTFTNTPAHLQAVLNGLAARGVVVKTVDQALDEIVPQI